MTMEFENKVAVITGAAQGIGKCIAEEFTKQGAKVCIIDLQENPYFVGDIADEETLRRFADKTNGDFTRWASINAQGEAYHMYRSEVRRSQRFVSDKDGVEVNLCSTTSVEDAFISRENYQFVAEIINKLPKEQRDALIIKFYRGNPNLSTKELSKKLDISETAFNKRIYDARKNLKKMYA